MLPCVPLDGTGFVNTPIHHCTSRVIISKEYQANNNNNKKNKCQKKYLNMHIKAPNYRRQPKHEICAKEWFKNIVEINLRKTLISTLLEFWLELEFGKLDNEINLGFIFYSIIFIIIFYVRLKLRWPFNIIILISMCVVVVGINLWFYMSYSYWN